MPAPPLLDRFHVLPAGLFLQIRIGEGFAHANDKFLKNGVWTVNAYPNGFPLIKNRDIVKLLRSEHDPFPFIVFSRLNVPHPPLDSRGACGRPKRNDSDGSAGRADSLR